MKPTESFRFYHTAGRNLEPGDVIKHKGRRMTILTIEPGSHRKGAQYARHADVAYEDGTRVSMELSTIIRYLVVGGNNWQQAFGGETE